MLYHIRVEPLRKDVTRKEVEELLRDFGTLYRVTVHRAPKYPRYNRISKRKDIFDPCYAVVSYTDRSACRLAVLNLDNTIKHPITKKEHAVAETVMMGQMPVQRSIRIREHYLNKTYGA